jgi:hypothetical protein
VVGLRRECVYASEDNQLFGKKRFIQDENERCFCLLSPLSEIGYLSACDDTIIFQPMTRAS